MKTRAHPGCATDPVPWKDLPPEILEKIALSRKADGAGVLVRLLQTCKSWHMSLQLVENSLWYVIGLAHFPSLRSILDIVDTGISPRDLHRKRLLGVRAHCPQVEPPGLGPPMTEYIFSYEVSYDGELLGEASGSYRSSAKIIAQPPLALPARGWLCALHDGLRLRVFVTRRSDLSSIMLADVGADCEPTAARHQVIGMEESLVAPPTALGITTSLLSCIEVVGGDQCAHLNVADVAELELSVGADFGWCEREDDGTWVDSGDLTDVGVMKYLAHYAPWP